MDASRAQADARVARRSRPPPPPGAAHQKCFQFPQSVGIAGGRPNSSLYFVAVDAKELFFLDPHITRPATDARPFEQYTEEARAPSCLRPVASRVVTGARAGLGVVPLQRRAAD